MDDGEGNTRPENKFVRDTENSMKPDAPDFLKEIKRAADDQLEDEGVGGFYHPDDEKQSRKKLAANGLSEAEQQAVNENRQKAHDQLSGVEEANEKEETPDKSGYYRSSMKERYKKAKGSPRTKMLAASFGKYGAITSVFIALLIVALTSFGSMSSQLNSWKENIYEHYGQNSAVMNRRSNFLMKTMLKTNRGTSTTIFGTKFKVGKKLAEKFKEQGIEYVEAEGTDGKKVKMLVVEGDDGTGIPIVADEADIGKVKSGEIDIGDGKKLKINGGDAMSLQTARNNSTAFNKAYNQATLTVTGKMAGWFSQFGQVPEKLLERLVGKNARNQTGDWGNDATEEEIEADITKAQDISDEDVSIKSEEDEEDEEGNKKKVESDSGRDAGTDGDGNSKTYGDVKSGDGKVSGGSGGDVSGVAAKLKAKAMKAASIGNGAGAIMCGFIRAIGAITATVGAIQTLNSINFTSKYLELADKVKAQKSTNATNVAMGLLNEQRPNEIYDDEGNPVDRPVISTTASTGFNMAFAQDDVIDENSPVTKMVNRENAMNNAMRNVTKNSGLPWVAPLFEGIGQFGSGVAATQICVGIQTTAAIMGLTSDVVLLVTTAGVGNAIKAAVKGVVENLAMNAIMVAVGMIVGFITPMVAQWLGSSLATVFFGELGGTVMWAGAQSLMNSNLQMSTGYLPDKNGAVELFAMTQDVKREWAEYDRQTLSPFDTSSQYTFLGSIVDSFMPIMNQASKGVTKTVSSIASLTGDSALALINPTASAASSVNDYELSLASEDNCTTLHSVGAEGTETCHKYNGAYVGDITSVDPDDVYQNIVSLEGTNSSFEGEYEDGNPKIKENSDLAKFIIACVANDTQPGEVDAAVQGFIQKASENAVLGGVLDIGVGSLPIAGDLLDIIDGSETEANLVWNSKQACTGRTNDQNLNERIRNYSTYTIDQRVLEEMGVIENNAVTAFLDDYYEKNPLDQSYEGRIAQFSGQTKEEVTEVLAFLEYASAVYQYDPSTKYAFGEPSVKIDKPLRLDHESVTQVADAKQTISNLFANIVYADVRNRVTVS